MCGGDPAKQRWIPYTEFVTNLNQIYARKPADEVNQNMDSQGYCVVQTKANIEKDLNMIRD